MAKFPAYPNLRQRIRRYPLKAGETFIEGAAVTLDVTTGEVIEFNDVALLGFALHAAGELPEVTYVLVALALPDATFILQGTAAPELTDVGVPYGLIKDADGVWIVDKATVDCVQVEKVYLDFGRVQYEVSALPSIRQLEVA